MTHRNAPHSLTRARAQILVIFGVSIFFLAGLLGVVIDGGNVYVQRRTAQIAADAAALAGARAMRSNTCTSWPCSESTVPTAVCNYAQLNSFGTEPDVTAAYYVDNTGAEIATIIASASACPAIGSTAAAATMPGTASGVRVYTTVGPFNTYLVGMFGIGQVTVNGRATAYVETMTGGDPTTAPFIACGGVAVGNSLRITSVNKVTVSTVVATTGVGKLANTPSTLPSGNIAKSDFVQANATTDIPLLAARTTPTPPYQLNPAATDRIYYLFGSHINSSDGSCGASGVQGGSHESSQPTPGGTNETIYAGQGTDAPNVSTMIRANGGCADGTDVDNFLAGASGCVMVLPVAYNSTTTSVSKGTEMLVGGWGAFYVWCANSESGGCTDVVGQYLHGWPVAQGTSSKTYTVGGGSATTVIKMSP